MTNLSADSAASKQYLVFSLGGEKYAVDILKVQEIRAYENVTRIANEPEQLKGVTNLRGVIVPIIDMRIKFKLANVEYIDATMVIVVNVGGRVIGIVVDGVSDVMTLNPNQIKPAPDFAMSMSSDYLEGLASVEDKMFVIVNIDKLLSAEELGHPESE